LVEERAGRAAARRSPPARNPYFRYTAESSISTTSDGTYSRCT